MVTVRAAPAIGRCKGHASWVRSVCAGGMTQGDGTDRAIQHMPEGNQGRNRTVFCMYGFSGFIAWFQAKVKVTPAQCIGLLDAVPVTLVERPRIRRFV